jgi:hypothetical protein
VRGCRVYQVANVKSEWNLVKTLPDLSGTGLMFVCSSRNAVDSLCLEINVVVSLQGK